MSILHRIIWDTVHNWPRNYVFLDISLCGWFATCSSYIFFLYFLFYRYICIIKHNDIRPIMYCICNFLSGIWTRVVSIQISDGNDSGFIGRCCGDVRLYVCKQLQSVWYMAPFNVVHSCKTCTEIFIFNFMIVYFCCLKGSLIKEHLLSIKIIDQSFIIEMTFKF